MILRRLSAVSLLVVLLVASAAGPAAADAAGPTNFDSFVTGLTPDVNGVDVRVVGGDAFLVVDVERGHTAMVFGYEHDPDRGIEDPYLRFDDDGTVWVNLRSPAKYLNESRYGLDTTEAARQGAEAGAPPEWQQIASDGVYAWHDHRIHWMSPTLPRPVERSGAEEEVAVFPDGWTLPIQVDGEDVTVTGELIWKPGSVPVVWILLGLVLFVVPTLLDRRRAAERDAAVVAGTVGVAAAVALGLGLAQSLGLPPGAQASITLWLLPVIAIAGLAVVLVAGRSGEQDALLAALAAVPLLVWAVSLVGALTRPILPTEVPAPLIRAGVAVVGGLSVGALVAALLQRTLVTTGTTEPG